MHDYRIFTFSTPTYCERCRGFLWGVAKQGVRCVKCQKALHKRCAVADKTQCTGDRGLALLLDSAFWEQVKEEQKLNAFVSTQAEQPLSLFQTLPANFMQFTAKLAAIGLVERGLRDILFWKRPRASLAAMCMYSMVCLRPGLLFIMPTMMMIGYIVFNYYNSGYAESTVASCRSSPVPSSESSQTSLAGSPSQASSSALSLSEAGVRSRGREKRSKRQATDPYPAISRSPTAPEDGGGLVSGQAGKRLARARGGASETTLSGSGSRYVDLAAVFGQASFGSAKYTENVHTTQNLTGTFVGVFDWVAAHNCLVDWSQPESARRVLGACVAAQMVVMVTVYWVPWYLLFLAGGNAGLLAMSPHARAFVKIYGVEMTLLAHERMAVHAWRWRRAAGGWPLVGRLVQKCAAGTATSVFTSPLLLAEEDEPGSSKQKPLNDGYTTPPLLSLASTAASGSSVLSTRRTKLASVFENQRWWMGFGWIPRLGSNERAKWSDESGKKRLTSLSAFLPDPGYEWASGEKGWEIDMGWALPVKTDEEGWVYTDNFWKRPSASSSKVQSYTRRRRWVRPMRPAIVDPDTPGNPR
ncbi:Pex24p-domain-containing protein [Linderina pennispora]|uniref:Pex24p-domain-containing protein n=1 Tax=Linderina pennispora TaxID=61395 RepID=A0A1Y1W795_9FUNG|nr:Pex24p-domain-containing protein [Linderina pennispora]ORX69198.1 Pex24p-domain-containing protein [Linderina pennispora]